MKIVLKNVETLIEIKDEKVVEELVLRFEGIYNLIGKEVYNKLLEMLDDLNKWEGR